MFKTAFQLLLLGTIAIAGAHRLARAIRIDRPAPPPPSDGAVDTAAVLRHLGGHPDADQASDGKPWAAHFTAYLNAHPDRQWIVGRSDRPGLSESEAADAARADAARQLAAIVRERLHARRLDADWLTRRVIDDVRAGRLQVDRLAERFERPYGTVWTESILLDVSPDRLDPFIGAYQHELRDRHTRAAHRLIAGAAVVLAAWMAFGLLNGMTKGYFTARLQLAATAITGAVVLLL